MNWHLEFLFSLPPVKHFSKKLRNYEGFIPARFHARKHKTFAHLRAFRLVPFIKPKSCSPREMGRSKIFITSIIYSNASTRLIRIEIWFRWCLANSARSDTTTSALRVEGVFTNCLSIQTDSRARRGNFDWQNCFRLRQNVNARVVPGWKRFRGISHQTYFHNDESEAKSGPKLIWQFSAFRLWQKVFPLQRNRNGFLGNPE